MKKTSITPQVLEMLLDNWGLFVSSGSWGPKVATQCGSIEREWNSNLSRYVWDDARPSRDIACDDALGFMLEKIIRALPIDYVRVLLDWYAHKKFDMCNYRKSILVSAKVEVQEKLEGMSYA